jgi:thiol:disulfide interchange protein DsbD
MVAGEDAALVLDVTSCDERTASCHPWTLNADNASEAFIPAERSDLRNSPLGLSRGPTDGTRGFSLVMSTHAFEDEPQLVGQRLRGVVPLARAGNEAHVLVDVPILREPVGESSAAFEVIATLPSAPSGGEHPNAASPTGGARSLFVALMLGLLGGLILNLMPCVLPVLAIKIFAITDLARAERSHVVQHGLAYLAGVLASMWALAVVVVALRAAGGAVGWGFQLQDPIFLAAICTILVVFALNLFGAFEITLQPSGPDLGPSVGPSSPSRSFFEGTLAVALATPCTAPFLGTAVGFAFASSGS